MKSRNNLMALAIATGAGRADTVNLGAGQAKVTNPLGAGVVNDTTCENISEGAAGAVSKVDSSTVDVSPPPTHPIPEPPFGFPVAADPEMRIPFNQALHFQ